MNNPKDFFRIGRVRISVTNPDKTIKKITDAALAGNGGYICVSNLRMVKYAKKNNEYNALMEESFMNLPDGTPLTWCGKAWGLKNIAVTNGPMTFKRMLMNGDKRLKHYLLGDTQEVCDAIKEKYTKEYGTNIVGAETLPFAKVEDFDYEAIANKVKESSANIIWTAMTAPKQDQFNAILNRYLPNIISIGVGRAFRISLGEIDEAPQWAQKLGIGGLFIRRRAFYKTFGWYIANTITVFKYITAIKFNKLSGKKYYE